MRWAATALALVALAGCGPAFPANGSCTRDADCRVCEVCGCSKAFASADVGAASCGDIKESTACPRLTPDCMSGPLNALCVSGRCQAVPVMR